MVFLYYVTENILGGFTMITCEEKYDEQPLCPHCKLEITQVWCRQISSFLGKRYIYFCPSCRSVLGVSHRKGFWMG
jgi:hypothetical protein